ncbi:MAG: FAD-binding protein, partial [Pseudomonadales bacterium]|nr:FAD-binding protein [Pseudomonadales bacterium]
MIFREVPKDGLPVTQARDHVDKTLRLKADVVVVGAGCGGSVLAFELASAGHSVIILESGPYIPSSDMHEDMAETLQRSYVDGALQVNSTFDVPVFQGKGMGGSTVIDAGIAFRAPDYILQSWADKQGLKAMSPDKLRPFYEKVESRLSVHINEPHEINECANKVIQGCDDLGWSWKPLARTVRECALTGHCLAGCISDRKQSALVTYLPWAVAMGAKLYSDCHVWQVLTTNGRASGVLANVIHS